MAQNSGFNALKRKTLRRARRIKIGKNGKFSIPVIIVPKQVSTHMLVSSVFTLASFSPYQKKVLQELRKVRKRIKKLIAEGYTFDGEIDEIFNAEEITFSKKTLQLLQKMKMDYLRKHAASYKGETDINKIIDMHNKEVAAKRKATREANKRKRDAENGITTPTPEEEDIPTDISVKISNIIREEEEYLDEIIKFRGVVDPDVYGTARMAASEVIRLVNNSTEDELEIIVDFWEERGDLDSVVASASTRFRGLFYEDYAVGFNLAFMNLTPFATETRFDDLFPEDGDDEDEFQPVGDDEDIPF